MATHGEIFEDSKLSQALRIINIPFKETWDKYTNDRIKRLHPIIKNYVANSINDLEEKHNIKIRVTQGLRTFEQQNEFYGHSRTPEELKRVGLSPEYAKPDESWKTNAYGGQSYHNYGLAVDIVEIKDGKPLWNTQNWDKIAEIFKSYGFEWLYDKIKKDKPHFQMTFGFKWQELKKIKEYQNKSYIDFSIL